MPTDWTVKNVADVKGATRGPLLLHLTPTQWRKTTRGLELERGGRAPKHGVGLIAIPDPSGDVIAYPFCHDQGPDTICAVRQKFRGGMLTFECSCRPAHGDDPQDGPIPVPRGERCHLGVGRGSIGCVSLGDCSGTCQLILSEATLFGQTVYRLSCLCRIV